MVHNAPRNASTALRYLGWALIAYGCAIGTKTIAQTPFPAPNQTNPTQTSPTQSPLPACQPPTPGQYLLLVVSSTPDSQDRVRRALPVNTNPVVCSYLDNVVTRASGFKSIDSANAWAKYLTETIGVSAFVARPSEATPIAGAPTSPAPSPTPSTSPAPSSPAPSSVAAPPQSSNPTASAAYNPQVLGTGYAVLVDFFSRPELATEVQQALGKEVGLVAYGQRPFLLAIYTPDPVAANTTLQTLTNRGFWAMLVDSRRVTLLKQSVVLSQN